MVKQTAGWQSSHAAACKAVDVGSIPTTASIIPATRGGALKIIAGSDPPEM